MGAGGDGQVRPPHEPDAAPTGNQLLTVLAALSNPHRIRILAALTERRNYVSRLAREIGIGRPLLHMHLARLEAAGLVTGSTETGADGKAMKYFDVTPFVYELTPATVAEAARTLTLPTPEPAPEPDGGPAQDPPRTSARKARRP
ncbi:ArsR/SmtB family transcription factor [Streptomyces avicenniae]|uniref:ArsR/SmtB family transcription factor n=1 Tax=Streptomyces avicenniae TaxID=500153 RepID=UPI000AF26DB1|nr:winged helix-turn-helix domain-containing protein [Streptomyces avicenniae]